MVAVLPRFIRSAVVMPFVVAGGLALPSRISAQEPAPAKPPEQRGLISRTADASPGYTLISPFSDTKTYLIDLDGNVVHTWTSRYRPGLLAYLLPDGKLLRGISVEAEVPFEHRGGDSGGVQLFSWEGELLWEYHVATEFGLQHHDIEPLPNGNVLVIVREVKTREQVRDAGRLPDAISDHGMWPCAVLELEPLPPIGARVVWEWHAWDHLIQDVDPDKADWGVVADHPERININGDIPRAEAADDAAPSADDVAAMQAVGYVAAGATTDDQDKRKEPDWLHLNAVDYHAELDQIALSSPRMNEVWIIDHGTTTEEARGRTGGRRGRGGDLLYRWGNPQTWQRGRKSDRQLFYQHDVQWIPAGYPGEGHLTLFNNGGDRPGGDRSAVLELDVPLLPDGTYAREPDAPFGPAAPCWSYDPPLEEKFFSSFISGAHRLANGNTLICDGPKGRLFEVTPDLRIAWDYKVPFGQPRDGDAGIRSSALFRGTRIAPDHPAIVAHLASGMTALAPLDPQPKTVAQILAERAANAPPRPTGWQPLVDKESGLSRWKAVNVAPGATFTIVPDPDDPEAVMVKCTGKPTGILRSDRMYENFVCEFEWRHHAEPGNAGFFVWADPLPALGGPFTRSIEVQVCNLGNGDWFTSHGDLFPIWGATMTPDPAYRVSGSRSMPKEDAFHARPTGKWNHYRITCVDGAITLEVNGERVTAGSRCSPSKGYLCLESEGTEVDFRKLRIWELPSGTHAADAARTAIAAGTHSPLYDGLSLEDFEVKSGDWKSEDWRLTCGAGAAELEIPLPEGATSVQLDWKRAEVPADGGLPFRIGSQRITTAGEKAGEWNRAVVTVDGERIVLELNGESRELDRESGEGRSGGAKPPRDGDATPTSLPAATLTLVNDSLAIEFANLLAAE